MGHHVGAVAGGHNLPLLIYEGSHLRHRTHHLQERRHLAVVKRDSWQIHSHESEALGVHEAHDAGACIRLVVLTGLRKHLDSGRRKLGRGYRNRHQQYHHKQVRVDPPYQFLASLVPAQWPAHTPGLAVRGAGASDVSEGFPGSSTPARSCPWRRALARIAVIPSGPASLQPLSPTRPLAIVSSAACQPQSYIRRKLPRQNLQISTAIASSSACQICRHAFPPGRFPSRLVQQLTPPEIFPSRLTCLRKT
ncbi:uncharacterized protein CANTADRAFT_140122 [Suhomyces tanzawaensis NRRL Y-17324]|uniref:Uncharacterized protein n=1 Tax=Suhomyces tanzawaensis NRRL Y-17324 TaxID=984487 RepID=A0A1E4SS24_9ASCO|nr:uncharacterized protein CANTADRAFT_140122 [Suhomyces tanzawaensis NRRL Y-17324]ODV82316.1 hypothetical protein CANTADRAFT_140122 [Suhomyces tanzawaensis NRRL Y-17324]